MIKVFYPLHPGQESTVVGQEGEHKKSEGPTDGISGDGYFCTTCYRAWPCQYEDFRLYKQRVYAKLVRAIASGASPDRVAEAVIHAVNTDGIGFHLEGEEPRGAGLRYKPITVEGI